MSTWRDRLRPLIASVIANNQGKSEKELRKVLRAAFPLGERANFPYKIWLDEINIQLGKKKVKGIKKGERLAVKPMEGQEELF